MTLPDTPFVCKNIDVIWWCEEHDAPKCRHAFAGGHCMTQHPLDGPDVGSCRMVERGLVDLSEVIPARRDRRTLRMYGSRGPDQVRYITEWRPV